MLGYAETLKRTPFGSALAKRTLRAIREPRAVPGAGDT